MFVLASSRSEYIRLRVVVVLSGPLGLTGPETLGLLRSVCLPGQLQLINHRLGPQEQRPAPEILCEFVEFIENVTNRADS